MSRRHLACVWACIALLLGTSASGAQAAAAAPQAAPSVCPTLLTLVESLPQSSIFSEILVALGASDEAPSTDTLDRPAQPSARRLARRLLAPGDDADATPGVPPSFACPTIFEPVCGTDNQTYSNRCVADSKEAKVACVGTCPCTPCPANLRPVCGVDGNTYDNDCLAEANGTAAACEGECPCKPGDKPCPLNYLPVCGADGITYGNDCLATANKTTAACDGECPCKPGDKPCPLNYLPVCGVDGVTYGNECLATANQTTVACEGECPCKPADKPCPASYVPVCGKDGFTYANECEADITPIACEGPCPCPGSEKPATGGGDVVPAAGDGGVCIGLVDPVCGFDGEEYTNACEATKAGVAVECKGTCPCPDLIEALQRPPGGMLLVPTDDSLLALLNATSPGDWLSDTPLLRRILSRHVILTSSQPGKRRPKPSLTGAPAITEALQTVRLYKANPQSPAQVVPAGAEEEPIDVLDIATGCKLVVQQIAEPLEGPLQVPA